MSDIIVKDIKNGSEYYYGGSAEVSAEDVSYDNTTSGMTADNVQDALDELKAGTHVYDATSTGTDAYAITVPGTVSSYAVGQVFKFMADVDNEGPATLNVNGLGAVEIKKNHDQSLEAGDIKAGQIVEVVYDGTNFQIWVKQEYHDVLNFSGVTIKTLYNETATKTYTVLDDGIANYGIYEWGDDSRMQATFYINDYELDSFYGSYNIRPYYSNSIPVKKGDVLKLVTTSAYSSEEGYSYWKIYYNN